MRTIYQQVESIGEISDEVYDIYDFPYDVFAGKGSTSKRNRSYHDALATFDIETTSLLKERYTDLAKDLGFMYVWQFCIDGIVVIGRTWEEYKKFLSKLKEQFSDNGAKLVCYVHSLQFEFQFLRNFFRVDKIFAREKRNVIKADIEGVEYRCSYALTNMSLNNFTNKTEGVIHKKLSGRDFDYTITRYPDTELTNEEYSYCINDVLGLYEGIKTLLKDDDLFTIPLTSTGYVRREFRDACKKDEWHMRMFNKSKLTVETYTLCKEASRGAIAGSNHMHTSEILSEVDSFDIKSSYPYVMATKYFPFGQFGKLTAEYGTDKFEFLLNTQCCIIVWECRNLKLKEWSSIPYISKAKCRAIVGGKCGNGKVYAADRIGMCCTEIDFRIIESTYNFDDVKIHVVWCAGRDMLSETFRKHLMGMFQHKTDLEDGDKYLYAKYKNKINATFGMMLTDIANPEILYDSNSVDVWSAESVDYEKALKRYYSSSSSFLTYQHGIWVLAHARNSLNTGMNIVKDDLVQVDTDSVKTLGDYREQFARLNEKIIEEAESFDVKPYSYKDGKKVYLGVWEYEGRYKEFVTLGAKKYAYDNGDGVHITVSGLSKNAGKWFDLNGGLEIFKSGTVVPPSESGRTSSTYNDRVRPSCLIHHGHEVVFGSNIAVRNVPYTLGMTSEWMEMVLDGKIDGNEIMECPGAWWQK